MAAAVAVVEEDSDVVVAEVGVVEAVATAAPTNKLLFLYKSSSRVTKPLVVTVALTSSLFLSILRPIEPLPKILQFEQALSAYSSQFSLHYEHGIRS